MTRTIASAWLRAPVALFLVASLSIGGVAAAAAAMRGAIRDSDTALADAAFDLSGAERLRGLRERVSRRARSYLLTGRERELAELRASEDDFQKMVAELRERAKDETERTLVDRLEAHEQARRVASDTLIEDRRAGATIDAIARRLDRELQPMLDALDETIASLLRHRQAQVDEARQIATRVASRAAVELWIAAGSALGVAALSSVALARTLRRIEGSAARTRRHLSAIVESSSDAVYSNDLAGHVVSWNDSAARVFGYRPEEILGKSVSVLSPPELADEVPEMLARIRAGERIPHLETLRRAKDGRTIDVVLAVSPIKDDAGDVVNVSTIARDISKERRLRRERDRFFDLSIDMVCIVSPDGRFKQLNPAFEAALGFSREELVGHPLVDFVHAEDRESTAKEFAKLLQGGVTSDFEIRCRRKDGSHRWLSWYAAPEPTGMVYAIARDVTERKNTQEKLEALAEELRHMAIVDELTGLHNRRGFHVLAEQELRRATRARQKVLFFFADLDGLKRINDELGHDVGDRAIREAGNVLRASFRRSDIIARLGGDEFVVLSTDADAAKASELVERLEAMVRQSNESEPGRPFELAISIGSTVHEPDRQEALDAVLKRADAIMYARKAQRKAAARAALVDGAVPSDATRRGSDGTTEPTS